VRGSSGEKRKREERRKQRRRTRLKNQESYRSRSGSGASAPTHCDSPPRARYLPGPLDLPLDPSLLSLSAHPHPGLSLYPSLPYSHPHSPDNTCTSSTPNQPINSPTNSSTTTQPPWFLPVFYCRCCSLPSHARTRSLAQASISPSCSPHSSHLSLLTLPSPW